MQYDVFTDFHINRFCNFDCSYCYFKGPERRNPAHRGESREKIVSGFDRTGLTWFIHMTGGEPFLHPEFTEVCRDLACRHFIGINTNLSTQNVQAFAESVPPDRVGYLHCSYHYECRQTEAARKAFVEKVKLLKSKGFATYVTQLLVPGMTGIFPVLYEQLKQEGIPLRPKVLKGIYKYKSYPVSYSRKERELILEFLGKDGKEEKGFFDTFFFREDEFVDCDLSFKGQPCRAGSSFVVIFPNGDVFNCLSMFKPLGNLFDGSFKPCLERLICTADKCASIRFGLNFCDGRPVAIPNRPVTAFVSGLLKNCRNALGNVRAK